MQVFNGVTFVNNSLTNTRLYAGYFGRVKTISTKLVDTDTVFLNAHYALTPDDGILSGPTECAPRIDADYTRLGGGAKWENYSLRVDYEILGSNNRLCVFQPPWPQNTCFSGWADQFVVALPSLGLHDAYLSGKAKIDKFQIFA